MRMLAVLLVGCALPSAEIEIAAVVPGSGDTTTVTPIDIEGTFPLPIQDNVDDGTTTVGELSVWVGTTQLPDAAWRGASIIEGTVPSGLTPGTYDVAIQLGDRDSVLPGGFTVLDPAIPPSPPSPPSPRPITFVQGSGVFQSGTFTTLSRAFMMAQAPGDLNLVVVNWLDTSMPSVSVSDTDGNAYQQIGGSVSAGFGTQAVFYAPDITGGPSPNTVTASFSAGVNRPEIRLLEYSGLAAASPIDVTTVATGTGTNVDSGPVTTTRAPALIVGANYVETSVQSPGPGFTTRVNVSNDTVEDMIVPAIGTYRATATQTTAARWVMHLIAFAGGP